MKKTLLALTVVGLTAGLPLVAAQSHEEHAGGAPKKAMTNAEKIRIATSAGPSDITKNAAVMDVGADGKMVELRKGTKGLQALVKDAKATLKALNVELAAVEEERAEPLSLPTGDQVARAPLVSAAE